MFSNSASCYKAILVKTERVNFVEVAYINPFVTNVPFLYPLKISENLTVKNGRIGNEWVKLTSSISNWVFMSLIKYGQLRGNPPKVFLKKSVMKIYSKFTGEHPCQSVISIKLLCNFIEITFRHACSPVNLLRIFRTPFPKNTPGGLNLSVKFIYPISHQCCISILLCQVSKLEVFLRFQGMSDGTIS